MIITLLFWTCHSVHTLLFVFFYGVHKKTPLFTSDSWRSGLAGLFSAGERPTQSSRGVAISQLVVSLRKAHGMKEQCCRHPPPTPLTPPSAERQCPAKRRKAWHPVCGKNKLQKETQKISYRKKRKQMEPFICERSIAYTPHAQGHPVQPVSSWGGAWLSGRAGERASYKAEAYIQTHERAEERATLNALGIERATERAKHQ